MQEYLLEFEQVHYTYQGAQQSALNNLTLRIPANKRCALIGQNGCGKTTLFLLANGLYKPQKGTIRFQGKALQYDHSCLMKLRQKVGLIFQDPEQQLVASTVEEDISYGLCNLQLPEAEIKQRVEQALAEFGLTELATRPVHHLSLGQKKRVSIADVMVLQPRLLLLDEPTAYLDRLHTRNLMATLKKIHADGTTILMATHDLDLVYRWADWIFVMDHGQLVLEGKPQDVFTQRDFLEELQLGVPLIYDMLFAEGVAEEGPILERVRQRILNLFRYF
ncbi:energy-coupling factor ABC transporter ATP-binding protein [Aetokthonos hydrillicola Thurmond2011]|jgi:cobalt/nickel transport system ATP-binding protein|uniref:ABC transporter ATP-binding protein n=1 Tax=Aetokthonos hydrillicola Thurmond2011 TaxID=2712845 RepID=A0AAP5MCD7_9CYAN|nr:ABC transporter ATP-binding protein [Aetokthonos hydrillicola]MBO3463437.1 ABC transporter ATP-binding protein [Aetokthonos hydrillicola CCALA 1050]MBW4590402.1 energy-coupling factor ABC transporter ATP-binding protein [Aetokthonos hydrillicola CCALA 1050]MDR9898203.1 energy-coupling factor ABC transporter ATP-binding protein [Aetokthonos hydrillicola Thurmond2011]